MRFVTRIIISALCCLFITCCKTSSFTVATWNIGHFANGTRPNSLIKGGNYYEKLKLYKMLIEDMNVDILCLNEYSDIFGVDNSNIKQKTKDVLLTNYEKFVEGNQVGFSCNAIFGNCEITNVERHEFKNTAKYEKELPRVANYYYLSGDLCYKKNVIKLICAHTISSNNILCQKMIAEIVDIYKDYDKVIMCGDWNTSNYKKFVDAGFLLVNDGSYMTYPKKQRPLDNIIVKGLKISNIRLVQTSLSDHCPLICRVSLK